MEIAVRENKTRRVGLLDEIRGVCILGVVVFHLLYDLIYIYAMDISSPALMLGLSIFQPLGAGAFVFISGIVSRYSRNNIKRGIMVLGIGTLISVISGLVSEDVAVRFGVLSLLGCSMIICGLLQKFITSFDRLSSKDKKPIIWGTLLALLFLLTFNINNGYIGLFGQKLFDLPKELFSYSFLYPLGLPATDFYSTDYFPLVPWLFLFLSGTFFGVYFKENKAPSFFYKNYSKFLNWAGKHSLVIYVIHQPLLMGVLWLLFRDPFV